MKLRLLPCATIEAPSAAIRIMAHLLVALLAFLSLTGSAAAQGYPNRPIRFIVPFAAGSAPDQIARFVGQHMQQTLGQPIVIDNKPGAQGAIAATEAARSAPDGYTIFGANNTTMAANPSLYKKLAYDPVKDFTPIARFITAALMLVVRPDFPAQNLRQFLALAKAKPGELSGGYASAGMQVALGQLKSLGGVSVLEVPYKSVPQAVNDILGGQLAFTFADYAVAFTQVRAGRLRPLGVTSRVRTPLAADVPSLAEEIPGFDVTVWSGLAAPAGTPPEIVGKLYDAAYKAVTAPEVSARLSALSLEPAPMNPEEFGQFIRSEIVKWAQQIKDAGIQPE